MPRHKAIFSWKNLYENILYRFNNYISKRNDLPYIQDQLSGTCVFSRLNTMLRVKSRSEYHYSLLYFLLGIKLLVNLKSCHVKSFLGFLNFSSGVNVQNDNIYFPKRILSLIDKFVRYIFWLAVNLQYIVSEDFTESQCMGIEWDEGLFSLNTSTMKTNSSSILMDMSRYEPVMLDIMTTFDKDKLEYKFKNNNTTPIDFGYFYC